MFLSDWAEVSSILPSRWGVSSEGEICLKGTSSIFVRLDVGIHLKILQAGIFVNFVLIFCSLKSIGFVAVAIVQLDISLLVLH